MGMKAEHIKQQSKQRRRRAIRAMRHAYSNLLCDRGTNLEIRLCKDLCQPIYSWSKGVGRTGRFLSKEGLAWGAMEATLFLPVTLRDHAVFC